MVRNHRKPLKAMVAISKKHRKTIDCNGQTAQKHSMVMVCSKTIENLQWSLQEVEDLEKLRLEVEDDKEAGQLIGHMLSSMSKRFSGGLKKKSPFNCLTHR